MNNRITEGTAIDSTTLAVCFQQGLARRISSALVSPQTIATMQNLALVMAAAEEIESKLDLSVKQAQLRCQHLATHTPTSGAALTIEAVVTPTPASITFPPTVVVVVEDPSMLAGARLPRAGVPVEGVVAGVGVPPPGRSSPPVYDENLHCSTCNAIGHAKRLCPTANCEVKPAYVSYAEYAVAAITDTPLPGPPSLAHQHAHQCVSSCDDSHAALHSIGTTAIPLGVMPDPADVNADPAATSGAINVLSLHALTMMFHGMVSVKDGLLPVRTLVDTGASHCYVSQAYVEQADIPVRSSQDWLKLADNTQAVSNGTCTLALDLQIYSGPIECFV
ncbi:TPA: hypothetical protein ACH3X1_005008 [Trebouxia sp. C0004]